MINHVKMQFALISWKYLLREQYINYSKPTRHACRILMINLFTHPQQYSNTIPHVLKK